MYLLWQWKRILYYILPFYCKEKIMITIQFMVARAHAPLHTSMEAYNYCKSWWKRSLHCKSLRKSSLHCKEWLMFKLTFMITIQFMVMKAHAPLYMSMEVFSHWISRWKHSLNRKTQKKRSLHCKGSLFIGTTLHVDVPHYTIFRILVSALIVLASLVLLLCILIFCDEMECVLFLKISG